MELKEAIIASRKKQPRRKNGRTRIRRRCWEKEEYLLVPRNNELDCVRVRGILSWVPQVKDLIASDWVVPADMPKEIVYFPPGGRTSPHAKHADFS